MLERERALRHPATSSPGLPMPLEPRLAEILKGVRDAGGRVVALTGAGISAESGIPTFRGEEGY